MYQTSPDYSGIDFPGVIKGIEDEIASAHECIALLDQTSYEARAYWNGVIDGLTNVKQSLLDAIEASTIISKVLKENEQ